MYWLTISCILLGERPFLMFNYRLQGYLYSIRLDNIFSLVEISWWHRLPCSLLTIQPQCESGKCIFEDILHPKTLWFWRTCSNFFFSVLSNLKNLFVQKRTLEHKTKTSSSIWFIPSLLRDTYFVFPLLTIQVPEVLILDHDYFWVEIC